jgi:hypothetical protein
MKTLFRVSLGDEIGDLFVDENATYVGAHGVEAAACLYGETDFIAKFFGGQIVSIFLDDVVGDDSPAMSGQFRAFVKLHEAKIKRAIKRASEKPKGGKR